MSVLLSIGIMVLSTICAALGQIGLKFGSMKLEKRIDALLENYALMAGIFFYGLSTILTILALRGEELSVLYPIAALNYVWVSFLSMKYLGEKMNVYKWLGMLCIIIGILFIV